MLPGISPLSSCENGECSPARPRTQGTQRDRPLVPSDVMAILLDLVASSIYSRRRFRHTSMLQSGPMKSVCFLLGAVIVALILPAQAKDRGRSLCASSGPPLPASAAELFKEAEKDYMPGIRIGRALGALGEAVLPELRQALRSGSVARQRVALYALGELGPGRPQLMAEILPFVTEGKTREVRLNALNALGKYGACARGAVPTILGSVPTATAGFVPKRGARS